MGIETIILVLGVIVAISLYLFARRARGKSDHASPFKKKG